MATYNSGAAHFMALLPGVLVVRDGCVHVGADGETVLPIFRATDVRWADGALEYEGRRYAVGDSIQLVGGTGHRDDLIGLSIPPNCDTDSYFVVTPSS